MFRIWLRRQTPVVLIRVALLFYFGMELHAAYNRPPRTERATSQENNDTQGETRMNPLRLTCE